MPFLKGHFYYLKHFGLNYLKNLSKIVKPL